MTTHAETVHLLGNLLTFHAFPDDTRAFALIECRTAPGAGAPPNRHVEDEGFLVLEGQVEIAIEGERQVHAAGAFVKIPNNAVHAFTNVGDTPSRMLILNWPGHDHVRFFRAAGDPVAPETRGFPEMAPPDVPKLTELAAESRIEFVAPDGAGE
jgi:quercetin dioxygenase-like cupin family protein